MSSEACCGEMQVKEIRARWPLAYGSGAIEVCQACGAWRVNCHVPDPWRTDDRRAALRKARREQERF